MCGLVLLLSPHEFFDDPAKALADATVSMQHRGLPGRTGYYLDKIGLGHVRLPIRGLGTEYDQPFRSSLRSIDVWVGAFVGELFTTDQENDALFALELLHREGPLALESHDGFWSMVLHAPSSNSTIVVVDHLAIKPLYWHRTMGVVASELRAIEALDAELEEDPLYFSNVLKWGYDPSERTPYRDVQRLEAGCAYWFEGPRLRSKIKYFDLEPAPLDIREELETAVRHRMIADVPVASLCSGGLDSTIVTLLAARSTQQKLTVFHVDNDEEEWVDQIDWPANVDLRKIELHPTLLQDAVAATEEPVDLGSVLPQYQLGQAVRDKGFHVCLSGDGADELFGGYGRAKIYDSQYSDVFCELVHYHLPRLDKTMMASTVELRSPFLAPRVVRAALAVPYSLRTSKESLKAAFSDIVPPSILQREKYPLKTRAAREGGMEYRKKIVDIYRRIRFDRNG